MSGEARLDIAMRHHGHVHGSRGAHAWWRLRLDDDVERAVLFLSQPEWDAEAVARVREACPDGVLHVVRETPHGLVAVGEESSAEAAAAIAIAWYSGRLADDTSFRVDVGGTAYRVDVEGSTDAIHATTRRNA